MEDYSFDSANFGDTPESQAEEENEEADHSNISKQSDEPVIRKSFPETWIFEDLNEYVIISLIIEYGVYGL